MMYFFRFFLAFIGGVCRYSIRETFFFISTPIRETFIFSVLIRETSVWRGVDVREVTEL